MSSAYKLTYFDGRGLAEISRLLFTVAGVEYEDHRLSFDKWPEYKPSTPFGQIPLLEVDGVTLCQSSSIARFLARRFQLAGHSDLDQARADMLIDCYTDISKNIYEYIFHENDEVKKRFSRLQCSLRVIHRLHCFGTVKEAAKKKFLEETLPVHLDNLEKLLKENNSGDGFFVGDNLTWADLGFQTLVDKLELLQGDDLVQQRPKLNALRSRVESIPKIAEWLAKRPETAF